MPDSQAMKSQGTGSSKAKLVSIPLVALLIGVVIIVVAMVNGQSPTRVTVPGGLAVDFQSSAGGQQLTSGQVAGAQPKLEQQATELQKQAKETSSPAAPSDLNIAGTWTGSNGLNYQFNQYGNQIVFQEVSPYGVTATGYGTVAGSGVSATFTALNGSRGRCDLEGDGNSLSGTITNETYGTQMPITMFK